MKIFIKIFLIVFVFFISFEIVKSQTGPICSKSINDYQTSCKLFKSSPQNVFGGKGKGFGGKILKVIDNDSKNITCTGSGKLIILSSNLAGATEIATSSFEKNKTKKISSKATGIYNTIPYYVDDSTKQPKKGKSILGTAKIAPDLSICTITVLKKEIPLPVFVVIKYGISK